ANVVNILGRQIPSKPSVEQWKPRADARGPTYQLSAGVSRPAPGRAGSGRAPSDRGRRRGSSHVGTRAAAGYRGMRMPSSLGDSQSSRAMDPTGSVPGPVLRLPSPTSPTWSRQEASSSLGTPSSSLLEPQPVPPPTYDCFAMLQ